jgi:hypothetical protein
MSSDISEKGNNPSNQIKYFNSPSFQPSSYVNINNDEIHITQSHMYSVEIERLPSELVK